ncbi:unnamed protein product [Linum trigynum]|uniref:Uncharacterized protein n=1 Tax=Linum trigynum TaxID=586398 RepID=A0AAV2EAP9_9ROSI
MSRSHRDGKRDESRTCFDEGEQARMEWDLSWRPREAVRREALLESEAARCPRAQQVKMARVSCCRHGR